MLKINKKRKGGGGGEPGEKITVLLILHNILETASNPICNEQDKGVTLRPGLVQWSRDEGPRWGQPGGDKRDWSVRARDDATHPANQPEIGGGYLMSDGI